MAYFKEHKNKIFAVAFSALALAVFLGRYAVLEVLTGGTYFRSLGQQNMIIELWNVFFYVVLVYGGLLVRNIQNDGRAYQNILVFVFSVAFGIIIDLLYGAASNIVYGIDTNAINLTLFLLALAFAVGEVVVGILLYINVLRYMRGFGVEWKKIRTLAIVFAVLVGLGAFPMVALSMLVEGGWLTLLSVPVSEAFCAVAIVFTLERLRRY